MPSNAAKTIPLIESVMRQNTNDRPKSPSILSEEINKFGGGGVKIRRRKSRKSRKNTKRLSI